MKHTIFSKASLFSASGLLILALNSLPLRAEQVQMYDHPPSAAEMGKMLFGNSSEPASGPTGGMKMRSISFGKKTPTAPAPKAENKGSTGGLVSIGLPIKFAYNSDEILDESVPFLEEVGKMLSLDEYVDKRLVIEGHTDAAGSDRYNLALSQRRANAVKHYLSQNYAISSSRLKTKGMGESKPLPGYSPDDEANRRVQFYSSN